MSGGIRALADPAGRQAFAAAIRGKPFFGALMGRDLRLWADNPGAPTRLYWLPDAALALSGRSAQLCGPVRDWEELALFLRFAGVEKLTADRPAPLPRQTELYLFTLAPGQALPPGPAPAGLTLDRNPPVGAIAALAFPGEENAARRDAFYSETCTAVAHGFARLWALTGADGGLVSMVGAYAMVDGEAYLATGETVPERRGCGIGGWLIASAANALAAEGWRVTLLCEENRRRFYTRLGFAPAGAYPRYRLDPPQPPAPEP